MPDPRPQTPRRLCTKYFVILPPPSLYDIFVDIDAIPLFCNDITNRRGYSNVTSKPTYDQLLSMCPAPAALRRSLLLVLVHGLLETGVPISVIPDPPRVGGDEDVVEFVVELRAVQRVSKRLVQPELLRGAQRFHARATRH